MALALEALAVRVEHATLTAAPKSAVAALAVRVLVRVELVEHPYAPETKWLWDSSEVRLVPLLQAGNYEAMEIRIQRPGG